jgi:arylsulfatase A-like enzyme
VLSLSVALCVAASCRRPAGPPSVVLLLADDLGWGDLSMHGAPDLRTPNIDRLAAEGATFSDAYAASPVCSPSRVALLTGLYPQRFGAAFEDYLGVGSPGLDPAWHRTLAMYLAEAGYRTAIFGKWNVAGEREPDRSRFVPSAHGFDHWLGSHRNHDYYTHRRYFSGEHDLYEDGELVEIEGYTPDILAKRAVRFVEDRGRDGRSFFLYLAWLLPHYPLQAPGDPSIRSPGHRPTYVKMVEHLDLLVGRVLEALRDAGLDSRTLVIFSSDNGGHGTARNHPYRGGKQELDEGGIRVPLILRWPGVVPPGASVVQPAITMDLTATILSVAGIEPGVALDGIDLLPIVTGAEPARPRALYWRRRTVGEERGGIEVHSRAVRDGHWKLHARGEATELYDLRADPFERRDRAGEEPARVASLLAKLEAWEEAVSATPPGGGDGGGS